MSRADTQGQRRFFAVGEQYSPFNTGPWNYNVINQGMTLPDGYILAKYPAEGMYTAKLDRYSMATEATEEIMRFLEIINFTTDQDADALRKQIQLFFQWFYAWNTELVWVDKVHPEDICAKILFDSAMPTYAARSQLVAGLDPDIFLRGRSYYEVNTWLASLTQYAAVNQADFLWKDTSFSLYYPGGGYSYGFGGVQNAFEKQAAARGLAHSLLGVLAEALGNDRGRLVSQYWSHRLAILTDAATYRNAVLSYALRLDS